jgi:D-arabinose 1-dehydrogenase-like Zn-dependent alcohol dehydrogenase
MRREQQGSLFIWLQLRPELGVSPEIAMKALCWNGKNDIRCETVPDPKIEDPRDVIIKVTACAICGSDLHLMDGMMPTMKAGDVLGHEFMGEVAKLVKVSQNSGRETKSLCPST